MYSVPSALALVANDKAALDKLDSEVAVAGLADVVPESRGVAEPSITGHKLHAERE